jgi:hypothetical protein
MMAYTAIDPPTIIAVSFARIPHLQANSVASSTEGLTGRSIATVKGHRAFQQGASHVAQLIAPDRNPDGAPLVAAAIAKDHERRHIVVRLASVWSRAVIVSRGKDEARSGLPPSAHARHVEQHAVWLASHPRWCTPDDGRIVVGLARGVERTHRRKLLPSQLGALREYPLAFLLLFVCQHAPSASTRGIFMHFARNLVYARLPSSPHRLHSAHLGLVGAPDCRSDADSACRATIVP